MRITLAALAAGALAVTAASAQAAGRPHLTLTETGHKVLYGHQLTLSGRVVPARAGQRIEILARPYGARARTRIAVVTSRAGGRFDVFVHPRIHTTYTASYTSYSGRRATASISVGVRPHVTARELGNGKVLATVAIGKSLRGRFVKLQRRVGRGWQTVAQRPLDRLAHATFAPLGSGGMLRIALSVNEAGKGYLGSSTHGFAYRPYKLTLMPSSFALLYGGRVTLAGRLVNGKPGQRIAIDAQRYGKSSPVRVATVTTRAGGAWSYHVSPRMQTAYQASWLGTGYRSARMTVGVKPLVTAHELTNGDVVAHVRAGKSLRGRFVKLQRLTYSGGWSTVQQRPLDRYQTARFRAGLPVSRVRVALSVNEAGAGLLGSISHSFVYRSY